MRNRSRWALLVLSLGAGTMVNSAMAEPGTGFFDALRVPAIFGGSESTSGNSPAPRSNAQQRGFHKPGNASSRNNAPTRDYSESQSDGSFGLLPTFDGLEKSIGRVLGTEPPASKIVVGEPATNIKAPPPPTLEPSPIDETSQPVVQSVLPRTATSTPKPAAKPEVEPVPSASPLRAPQKSSVPTLERQSAVKAAPPPVKAEPAPNQSSRRTWKTNAGAGYTTLQAGPALRAHADLEVSKLIDRRISNEPEAEAPAEEAVQPPLVPEIEATQIRGQQDDIGDNPPEPTILGQEEATVVVNEEPTAGDRDRFSTAMRLSKPMPLATTPPTKKEEYNPRPAVLEYQPSTVEEDSEVKPASFDLPPIISAAEARRLQVPKPQK